MALFTDKSVADQSGKTFFITGANTGIGFECAKVLAGKNARVLMGCRNPEKAENAKRVILSEQPDADIHCVALDLGDLDSVRAAAKVVNREPRLDVLINNAGIMTPPLGYTAQGFESQFGVNHLGPFLLTNLLLDRLRATPHARVVNTSSLAHHSGDIDFDDINAKNGYKTGSRYSQSKLANILFSYELQRRLDVSEGGGQPSDLISVACHPGVADTELARHLPVWFRWFMPVVRLLCNTPRQGAWPTLMVATADNIKATDFCGPSKRKQTAGPAMLVRSSRKARDPELAKKLWDISCEMTGVEPLKSA